MKLGEEVGAVQEWQGVGGSSYKHLSGGSQEGEGTSRRENGATGKNRRSEACCKIALRESRHLGRARSWRGQSEGGRCTGRRIEVQMVASVRHFTLQRVPYIVYGLNIIR